MTNEPLIIVTPPPKLPRLRGLPVMAAHQCYRLGAGGHLLRSGNAASVRGGLMALDCPDAVSPGEPEGLCQEIIRECSARGFQGVVCDFERRGDAFLEQLLSLLSEQLRRRKLRLYVPEAYERCSGIVMISSALSGGSLEQRLEEAAQRYTTQRLALAVERVAEDFFLPSPGGRGKPLSRDALQELLRRVKPSVFFSHELCQRYFTYMDRSNGAHFVLFDDGDTIRKKLLVAREKGIRHAVAAFDEVEDVLDRLL